MDCGMYKVVNDTKKDTNEHLHADKLNELEKMLNKDYPKLKVKKYIMTQEGKFLMV
jgi:hypothetical protein